MTAVPFPPLHNGFRLRRGVRWLLPPLLVVGGHVAVIALLLRSAALAPVLPQPPAAAPIVIELATLPTTMQPQTQQAPAVAAPPPEPEVEPKAVQATEKIIPQAEAKLTVREQPEEKRPPPPEVKKKPPREKQKPRPERQPAAPRQQLADNSSSKVAETNRAPQVGAASDMALKVKMNWQSEILARLQKEKRYPPFALRTRQQDTVLLRFRVDKEGHISDAVIVKSQGFTLLDSESLDLLQRVAPLPEPPADMLTAGKTEIIVPVQFYIAGNN
ncbi:hypothetical protein WM46_15300 [Citrobacter freundii complex sp. CFNIH2]|uniref:TonB family protein n=1 Tax=Citrobacter freundii complex sp. CFNIH2 TaxID=2066049 RepID=UPI000C86957E|nr:TonB family protein [Citrobacter freundii complex sp. CFNIH2]AUO66012.1 hypothetical protein WM46_15300 [Citrobacter freundii complex sp. CFNIH2]